MILYIYYRPLPAVDLLWTETPDRGTTAEYRRPSDFSAPQMADFIHDVIPTRRPTYIVRATCRPVVDLAAQYWVEVIAHL